MVPRTPSLLDVCRRATWLRRGVALAAAIALSPAGQALDMAAVRKSMASRTGPDAGATTPTTVLPVATPALTTPEERLARTNASVQAIRQMQLAARALAVAGPNNLKPGLPAIPTNSYGQPNGLIVANGVPKDLANVGADEIRALWSGADLPVATTGTSSDGHPTSTVTITQHDQQAVLNWQSFNIGKDTTVAYDQSAGGENAGRWTAFNVVRDPSANPTQILGAIRTVGPGDAQGKPTAGGQVYVLNTNGIIFGGSAQVNTHALVAAALPFNSNVLQNGVLNNPDTQFQFTALPQAAGTRANSPGFDPASGSADGAIPAQVSYAADGHYGDVEVQAGAVLKAPTNADKVGGRIVLVGENVANAGTISTPNGQAILAAGRQVGFAASGDPTLRGWEVYVGAQSATSGTAANATDAAHATTSAFTVTGEDGSTRTIAAGTAIPGVIDGRRDDGSIADAAVTIAGRKVDQLGVIDVSTSVSLNGRVDLLAEYNATGNPQYTAGTNFREFIRQSTDDDGSTGRVTLGAGSVTRILPELASTEKIVGRELTLKSTANIRGQTVHFAANEEAGAATLLAPSGDVSIGTGTWTSDQKSDVFVHDSGQIYLDSGTAIDVGGARNVAGSVTDNIVSVELRGPQLADYPLLRDGALRGQTIQVDLRQSGVYQGRAWIGTPLADASGYVNLVERTVGQLSTGGGTVKLEAGHSVVLAPSAAVDVSGGWIDYAGGETRTTKVISEGRIYDIAQATPDRIYSGIQSGTATTQDPYWGVTQSTNVGYPAATVESGYRQGGNGGSLTLRAPAMALDATLTGSATAGIRQRTSAGELARTYAGSTALSSIQAVQGIPQAGSLTIAFEQDYARSAGALPLQRSPTPPDVVIGTDGTAPGSVAPFPEDELGAEADLGARGVAGATVAIPAGWFSPSAAAGGGGFGRFSLRNVEGNVAITSDVTLAPGGSLDIDAANIDVAPGVKVSAPSGSLAFTAHNYSPYEYQVQLADSAPFLPEAVEDRGRFRLGKGAELSTAGRIVDDRTGAAGAGTGSLLTSGYRLDASGTEVDAIAVRAFQLELGDDTRLDVSGGVAVNASGRIVYGGAGRISLQGVLDPQGAGTLPVGQDPLQPVGAAAGFLRFNPGRVNFVGYSGLGAKSGSLALQAQHIQIGTAPAPDLVAPANRVPGETLVLGADFFGRNGIGNYALAGLGSAVRDAAGQPVADPNGPGRLYVPGLYVAPSFENSTGGTMQTVVSIAPNSWVADVKPARLGPVTLAPSPVLSPVAARAATSLKLSAPGVSYDSTAGKLLLVRGDLRVGEGSVIALDPRGAVSLSGQTVQLDGTVRAPGGSIAVSGAGTYLVAQGEDVAPVLPTVELGATSVLDAAGVAVAPAGLAVSSGLLGEVNTGAILDGGSVAVQGNVVARSGAVIDVSGTAGNLDLLGVYSGAAATGLATVHVESNGGSIALRGAQQLVSNATLRGAAGGESAQGGSLTVASGYFLADPDAQLTPADVNLDVAQQSVVLPGGTGSLLGRVLVDADGDVVATRGHFGVEEFWNASTKQTAGGLASLTLEGNVSFGGDVDLGATRSLTVGTGGFLYAAGATGEGTPVVALHAPAVTLGLPFVAPVSTDGGATPPVSVVRDSTNAAFYRSPTAGDARFAVDAEQLISLGTLSFQGFQSAAFATRKDGVAVAGDVRGNGVVNIAGSMDFTAGQVYPTTASALTLVAYDSVAPDGETVVPGAITFHPVLAADGSLALPSLPWSAGGTLTVLASSVTQGGLLRAPFGKINLGWNGSGLPPTSYKGSPADLLSGPGATIPVTETLTLASRSITSVAAVDPVTGQGVTLPFGYSTDGLNWFDPSGEDITTVGPPAKAVNLGGTSIDAQSGSAIDVRGGGDLYAYRWIPGVGGSRDVLAAGYAPNASAPALRSFAVLPSFAASAAPYAPFGPAATESGYVTTGLGLGDTVHLDLGDGNGPRDYTLLPARYALLPGAYLVTPLGSAPPSKPVAQPDGARVVAGYRANRLSPSGPPLQSAFEIALGTAPVTTGTAPPPRAVVRERAQYSDFLANGFFAPATDTTTAPQWRLPRDAGSLRLAAGTGGTFAFAGSVTAGAIEPAGRGGVVDLATPGDVLIANDAATPTEIAALAEKYGLTDPLVLQPANLSAFGAESLLIGGYRTAGVDGAAVTVTAGSIAVDNAGAAVSGADVALVARSGIELADKSELVATGSSGSSDTLRFGERDANGDAVAGSGNGVLVRVANDPEADIQRIGVDSSTNPLLTVDAGARLTAVAGSVTLDSTSASDLSPKALLAARAVNLNSGQVSVQFAGAGELRTQAATGEVTTGLVLSGASLSELQATGASLSLLSYSSIDFYGSGTLGSATTERFALRSPEIFGDGGTVTIVGKDIVVDNAAQALPADLAGGVPAGGKLVLTGETVTFAQGDVAIFNYADVDITGSRQMQFAKVGGLATDGNLRLNTPLLTGATAAVGAFTAAGRLVIDGTGSTGRGEGLGARLDLRGSEVRLGSKIDLASGALEARATGAEGVTVTGKLDVSGAARTFYEVARYTPGGSIALVADTGDVTVADSGRIAVGGAGALAADSRHAAGATASDGGRLSVSAVAGTFAAAGVLDGRGDAEGRGAEVSVDAGTLGDFAKLAGALAAGGFDRSIELRQRDGDLVVDAPLRAQSLSLSADAGSVTIADRLEASGPTGGAVLVAAGGSVTLTGEGVIDASAETYSHAGKGGSVQLAAGVNRFDANGNFLAAPAGASVAVDGRIELGVGIPELAIAAGQAVNFPTGAAKVVFSSAGSYRVGGASPATFAAGETVALPPGAVVQLAVAGTAVDAGDGFAGSVAARFADGHEVRLLPADGAARLAAATADEARGLSSGVLTLRAPQLDGNGMPLLPGASAEAAVDVAVGSLAGSINGASAVIVQATRPFLPVNGVVETVQPQVSAAAEAFAGVVGTADAPAAVRSRLLAMQPDLAGRLHVQSAPELVNPAGVAPARVTLEAGAANSTVVLPIGGSLHFENLGGVAGRLVSTTGTGKVRLADGTLVPLALTSRNVDLPEGATVVLDAPGVVTVALASGSGTLALENGATVTTVAGGTIETTAGTLVTLKSSNNAAPSTVTVAAGSPVVTVTTGSLRFSTAGTYVLPDGTTTPFGAGETVTVPVGAVITLTDTGTMAYRPGTSPVQLALGSGTFSFSRAVDITAGGGDLRLAGDWDLSAQHFGGEPLSLALRAGGDLVLGGTLSDGFASAAYDAPLLAAGTRSADYRLVAGADLSAADSRRVLPSGALGGLAGSILLGVSGSVATTGDDAQTRDALNGFHQVVRTGTGDIDLSAGGGVYLLNQFATIFTAGTLVDDPTLGGRFDLPVLDQNQGEGGNPLGAPQQENSYPAQFTRGGGNVTIRAHGDIAHKLRETGTGRFVDDSSQQLPNNWLYRRGLVDPATGRFFVGTVDPETGRLAANEAGEVKSTAWWTDFSNFFEGVGTFGGGDVTLVAGRDVANVDAVAATNARMPGRDAEGIAAAPDAAGLVELGGGDVTVRAGRDLNAGAYYVERGDGALRAGNAVLTNATRRLTTTTQNAPEGWLPTTLFVGKGDWSVASGGNLRLGPVANPFLLPAGLSSTVWNKTYFSTYSPDNAVDLSSLTGDILLSRNAPDNLLYSWVNSVQLYASGRTSNTSASFSRPWLRLAENSAQAFRGVAGLAPATLKATAYTGDLQLAGDLTLAASSTGTLELLAAGDFTGLSPLTRQHTWGYGVVRLLDSDPAALPGPASPLASVDWSVADVSTATQTILIGIDGLLREGEETGGDSLPTKSARHAAGPLRSADASPVRVYTLAGDISGLALMAGKFTRVAAGRDLTDVSLVLQNNRAGDVSYVGAGRDVVAFAPNSALRRTAAAAGFARSSDRLAGNSGRIEIGGPGTLEVVAGRNLDLGVDPANTAPGIVSIGADRNPRLPLTGADLVVAAGLGDLYTEDAGARLLAPGFLSSDLDFSAFVAGFLQPGTVRGARYLPVAAVSLGLPENTAPSTVAAAFAEGNLDEAKALALVDTFFGVLRRSGRDANDRTSDEFRKYTDGRAAIAALVPGSPVPTEEQIKDGVTTPRAPGPAVGSLLMPTREIKTFSGGDIAILAPSGGVTVGRPTDPQKADQGILTERGGGISLYAADNVDVGTSRIFTLRGGAERIWATWGNIAAGSGSKTVFAAPPTRVLIDAQSGDVQTDLAGLATGAGIGVLATRAGVKPDDVDLIAPVGTIDAGDAGIRASGNLNVSARVVLNAGNIRVGGAATGTPPPPAPPNLPAVSAATAASAASASAANEVARQNAVGAQAFELPSLIAVEVTGYGGENPEDDESSRREDGREQGGDADAAAKAPSPGETP